MKRLIISLMCSTALVLVIAPLAPLAPSRVSAAGAPPQQLDVSLTVFNNGLAPYGDWIESPRFGHVWAPRGIHAGWRPYSLGHWTYTDVGWTWMSEEPFGWATYHYGRWAFDAPMGWVWTPDTVWGPAWVAWRSSPEYTGWAPLGPGVAVTESFDPVIDPYAFVFVRTPFMINEHLAAYIQPPARNITIVRLTPNATAFSIRGGVFFNVGPRVEVVERTIGHPIPRLTIVAQETVGLAHVERNSVILYRPHEVVLGHADVRPVGPAVRVETPAQISARHASDIRALEVEQARQRDALEAQHREELSHPPSGMTRQQVIDRQETEHKAQQEQEQRERAAVDARYAHDNHGRGQ